MWQAVSQLLSGHFDQTFTIREKRELPGGEVHQAWCVSDGERQVFIKCDTPDFLQDFKAEADQLACLARSHTVKTPRVYGVGATREASFCYWNICQFVRLMRTMPIYSVSSWRAYTSGASSLSLVLITITIFPLPHSQILGSAAGQNSFLNNVSAGSYSLRRKRHSFRRYRQHRDRR